MSKIGTYRSTRFFPTRIAEIEINLNNLKYNLQSIKRKVGQNIKIIAVVKDDAYGHGLIEVSKTLIKLGVDMLGVATLREALQLRGAGINSHLIVLTPGFTCEVELILKNNIRQSICTIDMAEALSKLARRFNKKAIVHIKIDTGMGRLGIFPEHAFDFINEILKLKNIEIEGIFTHIASADSSNKTYAREQIKKFYNLIDKLKKDKINIPLRHIANSACLLDLPESFTGFFNMVRPGLILYGMYPSSYVSRSIKIKPVLSLKTKVIFIKLLPQGSSVSYGRTFITKRKTKIAVLGIGYGDGYNRALSNKGEAIIHGKKVPVIGRVCMDMIIVDVTDIQNVKTGDEAVLIGKQGKEEIKAEDIARKINTIPYEISCSLSNHVEKIFYE